MSFCWKRESLAGLLLQPRGNVHFVQSLHVWMQVLHELWKQGQDERPWVLVLASTNHPGRNMFRPMAQLAWDMWLEMSDIRVYACFTLHIAQADIPVDTLATPLDPTGARSVVCCTTWCTVHPATYTANTLPVCIALCIQ